MLWMATTWAFSTYRGGDDAFKHQSREHALPATFDRSGALFVTDADPGEADFIEAEHFAAKDVWHWKRTVECLFNRLLIKFFTNN